MDSDPRETPEERGARDSIGWILILFAGLSVIVYGLAFMANNFFGLAELGLQPADLGLAPEQLATLPPRLVAYILHAQLALGGFITAVGVATAAFALGVRRRSVLAWWGALATSVTWLVLIIPVHFILGFSQLSHLGVDYAFIVVFGIGAYLSRPRA